MKKNRKSANSCGICKKPVDPTGIYLLREDGRKCHADCVGLEVSMSKELNIQGEWINVPESNEYSRQKLQLAIRQCENQIAAIERENYWSRSFDPATMSIRDFARDKTKRIAQFHESIRNLKGMMEKLEAADLPAAIPNSPEEMSIEDQELRKGFLEKLEQAHPKDMKEVCEGLGLTLADIEFK